ncbi:MAG: DEAD/DEAH box helicase, partial [Acidobacteria bacterium]|nr:DEAD/DEAH box helicase [Acidobacteriota bacterium]
MKPLPIDPRIPEIAALLREARALVIVAPPGAGKTTRVPPALAAHGKTIVLQPRRIAARSLARRIAAEREWTLGEEVGWQVRFDRKFTGRTKLLIATEGILTARLQSDPLLSEFQVVVIDEFHERSVHADLALSLAKQAMLARDDLRIVVMSATLDAKPVAAFLGGCPVIEIEGRAHPVEIGYRPELSFSQAVGEAIGRAEGHVLGFLPGAPEIRRAAGELASLGAPLFELHGSLSPELQDAAVSTVPGERPRIILATNIAETSLTVEGVTEIVDSGLHKVVRYDPSIGADRLETERISRDSADQRAGRAGRTAPGRAMRLWDERQQLLDHREPEIRRVDLAGPLLDVFAWGGDPRTFEWFERPPEESIERALGLLERLGAIADGKITTRGSEIHALPLHPRHAAVLLEAGRSRDAAIACAILSEGLRWAESRSEVDQGGHFPKEQELLVAIQILAPRRGSADSIIRLASAVPRKWAHAARTALEHRFDPSSRSVRATEVDSLDGIPLAERPASPDPAAAGKILAGVIATALRARDEEIALPRGLAAAFAMDQLDAAVQQLRRARAAGVPIDLEALAERLAAGRTSLPPLDLWSMLGWGEKKQIDRLAPGSIAVPSGRKARLVYRRDGDAVLSIKLQELFGMAESPRAGRDGRAVVIELLAPNGRTVQTTDDLRSFWEGAYQDVRKELRGRYPR